jgi:uncharacterized protein YbgA (DUF1722 family)
MGALTYQAKPRKNTDVLYHLSGFFKKQLSSVEKKDLKEIIENYRREVPLALPGWRFRQCRYLN